MRKLLRLSIYSYLIFILSVISTVAQEPPRSLLFNEPIECELSGGQTHAYTLRLTASQIARVIAEQKEIDVVVSVIAPDGVKLFDVDSPNGPIGWAGEEIATIAAQQDGLYRIEIRPVEKQARTGRYAVRLDRFLNESQYLAERLAAVGRLWGTIKYFHPYLAYKDFDWDGALVQALPRIKAARTPNEYRQAISNLLQTLNDPATAIVPVSIEESHSASGSNRSKAPPTYYRIVDEHVVIHASDWAKARVNRDSAAFAKQQSMMAEIAKAKGIVLDCSYSGIPTTEAPPYLLRFYLESLLPQLVQGTILLGTERYRTHSGYAPQRGSSSGGYTSAFVTQLPGTLVGQAATKKPLALVIDEKTPDLVPLLSGLQASGVKIIQVGKSTREASARTHQMMLAEGVRVRFRTTEFVDPSGGSKFQADVELPGDSDGERVISAAITSVTGSAGERAETTTSSLPAPMMKSSKDAPYLQMSFPSEEYRLLALFRFWNVINYFFPYKHLTDEPWESVLTRFIPRFLENRNQLDYEMTVAEMVAQLQDTHGFVNALKSLEEHLGGFTPPISLRVASGRLTVASLLDESAAQAAGVKVGDSIVAVDGESLEQRVGYLSRFKSLSNSSSAYRFIYSTALRGAKGSKVRLRIEASDGEIREAEMTRTVTLGAAFAGPRKTPIYQVLANGYGYIDLTRLPLSDSHKSMDAVNGTPGLIFDMRGYPNGTAWEIGPRLSEKKNFRVAQFRRPFYAATNFDDEDLEGSAPDYSLVQKMPSPKGAIYKGKVVVLINEDAISQSEHTCLFFEAATDVTFIGSATNGANGDVTNLVLPGGIYVTFSGHDVRHADGRQLQRIGIQPHIKVEPTPRGIREGRDEVLEAAVEYLDSALKK